MKNRIWYKDFTDSKTLKATVIQWVKCFGVDICTEQNGWDEMEWNGTERNKTEQNRMQWRTQNHVPRGLGYMA